MVMSFTTKRLLIYDREEDMENGPGPITTLEFSQIYTVRTLRAGEHETFRVKQSDLKKILVVRSIVGRMIVCYVMSSHVSLSLSLSLSPPALSSPSLYTVGIH